MDDRARLLAVALAAGPAAACGDPLVVVGDSPGIVRIVAGIPDSAGADIGPSATQSLLFAPHGVAAGADGVLYIADFDNSRLLAVASSGAVEVLVDHSERRDEPRLREPDGLTLDGAGNLITADRRGQRIWRFDLATSELAVIAGTGIQGSAPDSTRAILADLDRPTGIAATSDGRIFFSEFGSHRIRSIQPDGTLTTFAGSGSAGFGGDNGPARAARLRRPAGLALGGGTLYVADSGNNRVRAIGLADSTIFTLAGTGTRAFDGDGGPAVDAKLNTPMAVTVSADGRTLFIADSNNHRVRSMNLETLTIETYAGTGDADFNGDLLEASATALGEVLGVTVSPFGFLYIADTGHHIVRRTAVRFVVGS